MQTRPQQVARAIGDLRIRQVEQGIEGFARCVSLRELPGEAAGTDAAFQPSPDVEEAPARAAHHVFLAEAGEGGERLEGPVGDLVGLALRRLASMTGGELVLQIAEQAPGIDREPLADDGGCTPGLAYRGRGRAVVVEAVEGRIGLCRRALAAAALRRAPGHQQVRQPADGAAAAGDRVGIDQPAEQRAHKPQRRLAALQIAPEPEQVVGRPARQGPGDAADADPVRRRQQGDLLDRRIGRHPDVAGANAVAQADGAGIGLVGDPAEAAGHHLPAVRRCCGEDPQRHRVRLEPAVLEDRHRRELDDFLPDIVHAARRDALAQGLAFGGGQLSGQHRAGIEAAAGAAEGGGDAHLVEPRQHGVALARLAAPPGRDVRQDQVLAGDLARDRRQEAHQRPRLDDAGAEAVGDMDIALAHRLDQAGDAESGLRVQFERVGEVAVDAPPDHVGALEAGDGAHMHPALAHQEVAALDQQEAEIAGKIGLLEVALVERSRGQQADARLDPLGARHQPGPEALEEGRQPLDVHAAEHVREGARQRQPVLQRVAGARGSLGTILQHPPPPVRPAAEIGGVELQRAATGRAVQRAQIVGAAADDRGRQQVLRHDLARPVDVVEQGRQQLRALGDTGGDRLPLGAGYEQGDVAERPGALARARVALVDVAVDPVRHAGVVDMPVGEAEALQQLVLRQRAPFLQEGLPMRPDGACCIDAFVIGAGQGSITGEQRLAPLRLGASGPDTALHSQTS